MERIYSRFDMVVIVVIAILTPIIVTYDLFIVSVVASYRSPYLNVFFHYFTSLGNYLLAAVYGFYILLARNRKDLRRWIPVILIAYASWFLSSKFVYALKNIFRRPRPFIVDPTLGTICDKPKDYSFPSGHSQSAWSLSMPVVFETKNKYLRLVLVLFAVLMSFSRVYCGVHYLSDVIWGALIGYLFSKILYVVYIRRKSKV